MTEFMKMVDQHLGGVLTRHGYRLVIQEPDRVIYESDKCTFTVVRDLMGSTEIDFLLKSHLIEHDNEYPIDEIFNSLSVPQSLLPPGYATKDDAGKHRLLETVAQLLTDFGDAVLNSDKATWERLAAHSAAASATYTLETKKRLALAAADKAWHRKDWGRYFELLNDLRPHLGEADRAKLAYAERRMKPH